MAKDGFLTVLAETLDQDFPYDYALHWDKRNHAVELTFILEARNSSGVETVDADGQTSAEDIIFEEAVLFYNPDKSRFAADDYLATLPYAPKKGLSREFIRYLVSFLKETADQGLDDLQDFLEDEGAESFFIRWDAAAFEEGRAGLEETTFYPYPRY